MSKDGSVAPKERVNVTFKPAAGDAAEELELPLKMMVLGDFTQQEDERKLEDRKPFSVDKNNFNDVIEKQNLSIQFGIKNQLQVTATVTKRSQSSSHLNILMILTLQVL